MQHWTTWLCLVKHRIPVYRYSVLSTIWIQVNTISEAQKATLVLKAHELEKWTTTFNSKPEVGYHTFLKCL